VKRYSSFTLIVKKTKTTKNNRKNEAHHNEKKTKNKINASSNNSTSNNSTSNSTSTGSSNKKLSSIIDIDRYYGCVGFSKWGKRPYYEPIEIVHPSTVQDKKLLARIERTRKSKSKHPQFLCYWYSAEKNERGYSFQRNNQIILYHEAKNINMHMLHRKIQSKIRKNETLSACETAVRRGYEQMQIMIQRKEFEANKYFSRTLQAVLLDNPVYQQDSRRLIGRRRFFQGIDGYSEWEPIFFKQDSLQNVTTINLQRGGKISFYPNLCDNLQEIKDEMENTAEFRQYKFRGVYPEPRLHALYSSKVSQHEETEGVANEPDTADHKNGTHSIGYKYHGIRMKAKPLSKLPKIYQLSQKLAEQLGIEHGWNIGADLLAYRDGNDSINWHADDTQQESIVLTLVVAAEGATRTVCVKPKNIPRKGDEQIEMYPIPGDGYQMDGGMQAGYLHGILKQHSTSEQQPQSRRLAIVFRHGKEVMDISTKEPNCST